MHLPVPNLDDRTFQDIVDEAKRRIPRYCPNWTDHNVSDPGITLIELFAWMTEQYLFRLNQVPDKNFVTFLDLIGVQLAPAQAAKGDITFTLSAAPTAGRRTVIPHWTEVATERTETEEAIVFTTDYDAQVLPSTIRWLVTSANGETFQDHSQILKEQVSLEVWGNPPVSSNAFYIGLDEDLSAHTLVLRFRCSRVGIGIDPLRPPWIWQVWRGNELKWQPVQVVADTTAGLNQDGEIRFRLPYGVQPTRLLLREARTWICCSPVDTPPPGETPYARSPCIHHISSYTIGLTVPVTHAVPIRDEVLGISNGQPAQKFRLQHRQILRPEGPEEVVQVSTPDGGWETWQTVPDYGDSGENDKHCTINLLTGEVEFGPAIRQRNGTEPQFGAIPPCGATIRMLRYRVGGGVRGNIAGGRVRLLKSTLPYVATVVNHAPITGGLEAQSLEDAKLRGPSLLRTRHRAVTADDYEFMAQQIEGVGRVRCLQPRPDDQAQRPGTVVLVVIPSLPPLVGDSLRDHIRQHESISQEAQRQAVERELQQELKLAPSAEMRLRDYLDRVRLLTTRIEIREPRYVWVTVQTRIKTLAKADPGRVVLDVKAALYRFLHPLYGGPDGSGWPFGRALTIDKVYALIQSVPGVEYSTELALYLIDLDNPTGQRLTKSSQVIELEADQVVVSYYHNVYHAR